MTELQFLLELFLNHKLGKDTKEMIVKRIGEVEANYALKPQTNIKPVTVTPAAPITNPKLLAQMEAEGIQPTQPEVIAQTPAAQEALKRRNDLINASANGKPIATTAPGTRYSTVKGPAKF